METEYELAKGGFVTLNWVRDVQAVQPMYENTLITLANGTKYLLRGRWFGV